MKLAGARRAAGLLLTVGIAVAVLAGCTSDSGTQSTELARPEIANRVPAEAPGRAEGDSAEAPATADAPATGSSGGALSKAQLSGRDLVRSATVELRAPNIDATAANAREAAHGAGGYAASEEVTEDSATLTLRVPSAEFEAALDRLAELGRVEGREVNVRDVTDQVVDVDSRVASQQASVARVRALLDRADTISDIMDIESELTSRESELEALLARQEALKGMVAMSDIRLTIEQPEPRDAADDGGFLGGISGGWDAFVTAAGVLLTVLGAALPFLAAIGIPAGLLLWWLRRRKRDRVVMPQHPEPADT